MEIGTKTYISTVSFDKTSVRPLRLIKVFTLPNDLTRRSKKPQESFEHAIESIRALLNSWKMGPALDNPRRCENPRLFCQIGSAHLRETVEASGKDEVANECITKG